MELKPFSFIVKVWIDPSDDELEQVSWHGLVTYVPSGKHRFVQSLDDVMAFVVPYLIDFGVTRERAARSWPTTLVKQGERTMAEIIWKLDVTVSDGPKFTLQQKVKVDAYERVDFELRPGYWRLVEIQPNENLVFMMVKRSEVPATTEPKPNPDLLYYTINDGKHLPLDSVHAVIGLDIEELLQYSPTKLKFFNKQEQPVTITALLARTFRQASSEPATGTPAAGTPAAGTPAAGTPTTGTPATGTPAADASASSGTIQAACP